MPKSIEYSKSGLEIIEAAQEINQIPQIYSAIQALLRLNNTLLEQQQTPELRRW